MISSINSKEEDLQHIKKITEKDLSLNYNYDNSCGLIVGSEDKPARLKCRICFEEIEEKKLVEYNKNQPSNKLIHPCYCKGSIAYCHQNCLKSWVISNSVSASKHVYCEICKSEYVIKNLKGKLSKLEKKSILKVFSVFIAAIVMLNLGLYFLLGEECSRLFSNKFIYGLVNLIVILIFLCAVQDKIKMVIYGANIDFEVYDISMRFKT